MLEYIRWILAFTQVGGAKIDASVFRLNCSATVVMLFTLSATVFGRQYVGNPIDCIHNRDVPEALLNAFCWIHSTYTIPRAFFKKVGVDVPFPGVDHSKNYLSEDKKYTKYYQWVGFTLFIQDTSVPEIYAEDGDSTDLRNVGILSQHYTASEDLDLNLHNRESPKPGKSTWYSLFRFLEEDH